MKHNPDMDMISAEFQEESSADKIQELIKKEIESVNKKLVNFKRIKHFQIIETELAMTSTKKIKRYLENR
jgi:long-chain acyl-CoA synthetase